MPRESQYDPKEVADLVKECKGNMTKAAGMLNPPTTRQNVKKILLKYQIATKPATKPQPKKKAEPLWKKAQELLREQKEMILDLQQENRGLRQILMGHGLLLPDSCPHCGAGQDRIIKRGRKGRTQRFSCNVCGGNIYVKSKPETPSSDDGEATSPTVQEHPAGSRSPVDRPAPHGSTRQ